eukprot:g49289.t1
MQASLDKAKAELKEAETKLEKAKAELEKAEAKLEKAKAELEEAKEKAVPKDEEIVRAGVCSAQAGVTSAQAGVTSAQEMVSALTRVVANFLTLEAGPPLKRVKPSSCDLDQQALVRKGDYVNVRHMKLAGLSSPDSDCLLFVRQETVDLWNALERATIKNCNLCVDGPPGTGKSTEAWAWALWKAKNQKTTVVWFHFSKTCAVKAMIDGKQDTITVDAAAKISQITTSEGDFLVVDGVTKAESVDIRRACSAWREAGEGKRSYVLVTSVSIVVPLEQNEQAQVEEFTVGSWTFEQYEEACQKVSFFDSIKTNLQCPNFTGDDKKQLLLSKYEFAGGSARWMFEFSYFQWQRDFESHYEKIADFKTFWTEGAGDAALVAVNHLRSVTVLGGKKNYFFVSKHAMTELARKCDDQRKFLLDSYKKAEESQNPAFKGWIFEFDVDYQLRQAQANKTKISLAIRSTDPTLKVEESPVSKYITFESVGDLVSEIKELGDGSVLWGKPGLWCQKAYDFLSFRKLNGDLYMTVANATVASTHSVLLEVVHLLAVDLGQNRCPVEKIRFDFIVPKNAEFKVGAVTGSLCMWKNVNGKPWPNKDHTSAYLDFIVVAEIHRTFSFHRLKCCSHITVPTIEHLSKTFDKHRERKSREVSGYLRILFYVHGDTIWTRLLMLSAAKTLTAQMRA